jgi:hypothetical protein
MKRNKQLRNQNKNEIRSTTTKINRTKKYQILKKALTFLVGEKCGFLLIWKSFRKAELHFLLVPQ